MFFQRFVCQENIDNILSLKVSVSYVLYNSYKDLAILTESIFSCLRFIFVLKSKKPESKENILLSNGKFKNQFRVYIQNVLSGEKNKELRHYSESAIEFTEKSIDLMNQTTHKLEVQKHFAEVCVISTISVVSLIKAINEV